MTKKWREACRKLPLCGGCLAALFLCVCLLGGCAGQEGAADEKEISVFYINQAETKITPITYGLKSTGVDGQVDEAISAMKENPVELSLRTPVNGYDIVGWNLQENLLVLDVSEEYKNIQPTTEILIRAAIVRTLTQIEGVDHVSMTVKGEGLTDSLGAPVGPMNAEMFIDNAGNEINSYEKIWLKLYYANESGDRLIPVSVRKVYNSNISLEKLVVESLIAGPEQDSEGVYPVLNPAIKVLGVTVKDGTCYVNLDDGFNTQVYNVTGDVVIYSIVNSLVELPNVNKVQISVNGATEITYRESFPLTTVFERNLDLVESGD